ncbi:MAG TPA: MarR family winged helix-turn-helix transcriptional regulator [Acidimicrobiales bacterium]|nr:MarR family winged helix-turn-helix transcriptional regulator [Acidimicrobiales bacterium]
MPARETAVDRDGGEASSTGRAAARLAKHVEGALAHVELSLPQYRVLVVLAKGSAAASALASRLAVSPPSVTALVDGLVGRGFVERQPVSGDRRRVDHVLTDKGRRVLADADGAVDRRLQDIAAHLPPSDRTRAMNGLDLWHKAMDAYLGAKVAQRS